MVLSKVVSQEVSSPSIFSQYTYDEKHTQYLMYPYDYFALDIQTEFAICLKGTGVYDSDCGHRTDTLNAPVATAGTGITKTSFIANWNAVIGANGYAIDIATDSGFTDFILQDERLGNTLNVSVTGLDGETTYYYRVRAYNDFTESENSNIINVTTTQITFNDYFLPSKDESTEIWNEVASHGLGGFNDLGYGIYRTSSDTTDIVSLQGSAWVTDMLINGNQQKLSKGNGYSARACRSFISATVYNLRDLGPAGGYIFIKTDNGNGTYTYYELAPSDVTGIPRFSNMTAPADYLGTGTAIGTGSANTDAIIAQVGHTDSAAKLCKDLVVINP